MDADKIKAALEALKNQDAEAALVILEEMIASAAGAESDTTPEDTEALVESGEEEEEEQTEMATETPEKDEETKAAAALSRALGIKNPGDAARFVEEHKELASRVAQLDADKKALEDDERRGHVADLVKLGFETAATAWVPLTDEEMKLEESGKTVTRRPCKRLASEPLPELRNRMALLKASRPKGMPEVTPPTKESVDITTLSRADLEHCKKHKIDPKDFAEKKANAVRRIA